MDLVQANIMVETFINTATDLQNLAREESDPRIVRWLMERAAENSKHASDILKLPIEGWDWLTPAATVGDAIGDLPVGDAIEDATPIGK